MNHYSAEVKVLIGKRSKPSQRGGGWKYVVYMLVYIYVPYVHNLGVRGRLLRTRHLKRNGHLGKQALEVARLVNEESDSRFEVQREKHRIHTRPTRSMAVRKRLLELLLFFTKLA